MVNVLLDVERQIAHTFGYVWAIRFEDALKIVAGFILGSFYVIYQVARIFLNFKRKDNLEDGEVIFLKMKNHYETWANAKTLLGSFYAVLTMVIFHGLRFPRHFLQSKKTMKFLSIATIVFCVIVLYIAIVYTMTVFIDDSSVVQESSNR